MKGRFRLGETMIEFATLHIKVGLKVHMRVHIRNMREGSVQGGIRAGGGTYF